MKTISNKMVFPEIIERPVYWGPSGFLNRTDKHKAITDANTGKLFSIVSKDYKVIKHEDAVAEIERAISENPTLGKYETNTALYNDGGRMRRTYKFTDISIQIQKDDTVNPELHLCNSYDLTWPFIVVLGAYRMVCANGLVIGEQYLRVRKRHVFELSYISLREEVSTALERFESQIEQWKEWADRQLTSNTYNKIINVMELGIKAKNEIEDRIAQESVGLDDGFPRISLWAFYNVLTSFISHRTVSLNHRVELERRLRVAIRSVQ